MKEFREWGHFCPPHPWAAPKKPILNRVKTIYIYATESSHYTISEFHYFTISWFIGDRATAHEILAIKTPKKMLNQQKYNEIHRVKTLISLKQLAIA